MRRLRTLPSEALETREILLAVASAPQAAGERLAGLSHAVLATVLQAGTAQGLGTCMVASLQVAGVPPGQVSYLDALAV